MDPTAMSQLVSTVGFPIVAFLLMYRMARDTIQENTRALNQLEKRLQKEL